MKKKFTFEDYREALIGVGDTTKERIKIDKIGFATVLVRPKSKIEFMAFYFLHDEEDR